MVHRDVKPENVLMDDLIPKIADFGLVRSCKMKAVTQSVDFKGTVMYMPPEQFMDFRHTDVRGDIYSLGKILYEAVAGKIGTRDKALHFKTVGLDKPESAFFESLDRIIRKSTREDRGERYQSVAELRNALLEALAIPEKGAEPTLQNSQAQSPPFFKNEKWIWLGVAVAVLSVGLMTLYHVFFEAGPGMRPSIQSETPAQVEKAQRSLAAEPAMTEDGALMLFVPGGVAPSEGEIDARHEVAPFYMDETPVTNHQYVEFLNDVLPEVSVENDVVLGRGSIWLILGEVVEGYEPILMREGKFLVSHSGHAACPVLRVTAFGAQAYARHYEKRLPTRAEWLVAYNGGKALEELLKEDDDVRLPIPSPVLLFEKNGFGIRGLNQSINEWAFVSPEEKIQEKQAAGPEFAVLGKLSDEDRETVELASVKRLPWEAFDNVGFRCARNFEAAGTENGKENPDN
jgi:serine/threonine-protein kinase